jgi:hypothetical protein
MGTTLTGTTPQDTYDSLIKVTDNGPLSGSLKKLTDGLGNDSALSLSTGAASIAGTLAVTGAATLASTLSVTSTTTSAGLILSTNDALFATDGSILRHSTVGLTLRAVTGSVFNFSLYSEDETAMMVNPTGGNNLSFISQIEVQNGIKFPATQAASADANTLDDYEEGTFTATFTPNGSGTITLRGDAQTMRYTKIGRQVTIAGGIFIGSVSLPIGTEITLGGLPFTAATGISFRSTAAISFFDAPTYPGIALTSVMVDNTATLNIQTDASTLGVNDEFYITLTYFV